MGFNSAFKGLSKLHSVQQLMKLFLNSVIVKITLRHVVLFPVTEHAKIKKKCAYPSRFTPANILRILFL